MISAIVAIIPIVFIFVGLVVFKKGGTTMGILGWLLCSLLAMLFFETPLKVVAGASVYGLLKSLGISMVVLFSIFQIVFMGKLGALERITGEIKRYDFEKPELIMLLNIGFGSFLVGIGATPVSMLPPIMMGLGFSPLLSIALPCLGYNPLTSFALLGIPITLPAEYISNSILTDTVATDVAYTLGLKVSIYLPVISTGLAIGMLYLVGKWEMVKKGLPYAIISGVVLAVTTAFFAKLMGPMIPGIFGGLAVVLALILYKKYRSGKIERKEYHSSLPLWKALYPWITLVGFCLIVSLAVFKHIGPYEFLTTSTIVHVLADRSVNLQVLSKAYFWMLISTLISIPILKPSKKQAEEIIRTWLARSYKPVIAASIFFAIAFVMDWSGHTIVSGAVVLPDPTNNMNHAIGEQLSRTGPVYALLAPLLGLFGAIVAGSETPSNVMFARIQHIASKEILGAGKESYLQIMAAHSAAGGIASGITPAKIVNAAAVIDEIGIEGDVIRKTLVLCTTLVVLIGVMTFFLV
ncbi:MAG: L-lactate permease [Euryarchaeota archaeon]|nr:L-lactate permease [Euryarchaeota archaeon]